MCEKSVQLDKRYKKCWAQLSAHCTILGVKSSHIFPPIKPWTPMGAFGGLKHVDSINFKEKYYHAFQFEQLFWSHILPKICVLFSTIYCVKAPVKNTKQVLTSLAGRLQHGLWIAFEHYTSKNVTCNDLSITLLVPCILCLMNGGARNLAFYKQWDQKTLWAVIEPSQEQTGLLTLNGSASPSSIECQQRSLITPLIYRLIRLWRNANEPSSTMPCLPYIKVITM